MKVLTVRNNQSGPLCEGDWQEHTLLTAQSVEQALQLARATLPHVVLADLVLPGGDGWSVPERLAALGLETAPLCVLVSDRRLLPLARRFGADGQLWLEKPVRPEALMDLMAGQEQAGPADAVYGAAVQILDELGLKHHLAGYPLLLWAVQAAARDHTATGCMAQRIYAPLAVRSGCAPACVERNMRFAIEAAWDRGRVETIWRMFGYTVRESVGKPSNREFIAMAAERARAMARP